MSESKPIDSCLCYPHTFAELLALSKANRWNSIDEITHSVGCGGGCGLCRPYIAKMLETGETEFAILPIRTLSVEL